VERQGFVAGGRRLCPPSLDNVEVHSLSPFIRECIVRVVRVEGCVRGSWGVSASSGKEKSEEGEEEPHGRERERESSCADIGERSP